jgi:hypothetical protein
MAPSSDAPLSNGDVVEKIVTQAKEWYSLGIDRNSDFQIGKLLHMIQDSYSASHVIRDEYGRILQFQGYDSQDPKAHGLADQMLPRMKSFLEIQGTASALAASTEILKMYAAGAPFSKVEVFLREQVYVMAPNRIQVPSGGSADVYLKKG